jgi:hypothetical protein
MAWRRAIPVLLPSSAALLLFASFAGASSCLPSASAVREEHPGSWPSWTLRAPGHEGNKCWYPTSRTAAHDHRNEAVPRAKPVETPRPDSASAASPRTRAPSGAPLTNGVGRSHETLAPEDVAISSPEENSFADRFDAVFEESFFDQSSLLRRMADLMGTAQQRQE